MILIGHKEWPSERFFIIEKDRPEVEVDEQYIISRSKWYVFLGTVRINGDIHHNYRIL